MIFGAFCFGITKTQACWQALYLLLETVERAYEQLNNYKQNSGHCKSRATSTTPRHSWTSLTLDPTTIYFCFSSPNALTRFPRFFRLATTKWKRSLRRLSNRRLRGIFMEPFALFLRIFSCSFCVFCTLFSGTLRFFSVSFYPGLHSKQSGRKWGGATSFGIFPWYFPLYTKLNLSQKRHRC